MINQHEWFVTIYATEVGNFTDPYELLVYVAVKSHCANGKREASLSLRDIAKRSCVKSPSCVQEKLKKLIQKGLIKVTGSFARVGGTVNVYKVSPSGTVSVSTGTKSVPVGHESVLDLGTKTAQYNKVKKETKTQSQSLSPEISRKDPSAGAKLPPEQLKKIFNEIGGLR